MYVDYGPGPNKHTWGSALLSKFPIVNSTHHLLPSPVGELAPAIEATIDAYGELIDIDVDVPAQRVTCRFDEERGRGAAVADHDARGDEVRAGRAHVVLDRAGIAAEGAGALDPVVVAPARDVAARGDLEEEISCAVVAVGSAQRWVWAVARM